MLILDTFKEVEQFPGLCSSSSWIVTFVRGASGSMLDNEGVSVVSFGILSSSNLLKSI